MDVVLVGGNAAIGMNWGKTPGIGGGGTVNVALFKEFACILHGTIRVPSSKYLHVRFLESEQPKYSSRYLYCEDHSALTFET